MAPKKKPPPFTVTILPSWEVSKILHGAEDGLLTHPGALLLLVPPDCIELHRRALSVVLTDEDWARVIDRRSARSTTLNRHAMVRALGEIVRAMIGEQFETDATATYRERADWWKANVPVLIDLLAGPYPQAIRLLQELEGMGRFDDTLWERARALGPRAPLAQLLATAQALRQRLERVRDDSAQTGEPALWRERVRRATAGNWKRALLREARATLSKAGITDRAQQTELLEVIGLQRSAHHLGDLANRANP